VLLRELGRFRPEPDRLWRAKLGRTFGYQTGLLTDRDYRTVLQLLARDRIDPEPLVMSRIDLSAILEGWFENSSVSRAGR
jgi:threonine dehydrogenase-like Zn-dependent dehydrogenase